MLGVVATIKIKEGKGAEFEALNRWLFLRR
jgi:hypothetical protein